MATLLSQQILCCGIDGINVIGLRKDQAPDHIIATINRNIIIKYKLSDRKPVRTWSTLRGQFFTSPAIWDQVLQKYVVPVNHHQIYAWSEAEENLEAARKYSFASPIHNILSDKHFGNHILFKNGFVETLSSAIETRKDTKVDKLSHGDIIDGVLSGGSDYVNVGLLTFSKHEQKYHFHLGSSSSSNELVYETFQVENKAFKMLGSHLYCSDDVIKLLTLWSDNSLWCLDTSQPVASTLGCKLFTVGGISINNSCALTTMSPTHLGIYGADKDDEGAVISIWDMKFGIVLSKQKLKVYSQVPSLWDISQHLFVLMDDKVLCLPYRVTPSCLANVIGHRMGVADGVVRDLLTARQECDDPRRLILYLESQFPRLCSIHIPQSVITSAMLPVIMEKQLLPELYVSLRMFEDIKENILVQLVSYCIKLEDAFLNDHEKEFDSVLIDRDREITEKNLGLTHPIRVLLLDAILCVIANGVSLRENLKTINMEAVGSLLTYLSNRLGDSNFYDENHSQLRVAQPPSRQILLWISCLLDSCFNNIIMASDLELHKVLFNIADTVNHHIEITKELSKIEGPLMVIKNRKSLPKRGINTDYFIEIVNF